MSTEYSAPTTILGGMPCIIHGTYANAEPDVGIMHDYIDDHWLTFAGGSVMGNNITDRITSDEWNRLDTELMEEARSYYDEGI